ncbi:MAG: sulfatase-like hydrolase/transferase [Acidobacteriota bacterium]
MLVPLKPLLSKLLLALLCAAAVGCGAREKPQPPPSRVPVILISIDTLRADHLPAWGYRGVETPNLDHFRRDSILFSNAWSQSPMTLPSHLTMLTGLLPYEHGVRDNIGFRFHSGSHSNLPQILEGQGYSTGAAVSSYVLRGESGLRDCFQFYDDSINPRPDAAFDEYQRPGAETTAIAKRWIDEHSARPFFFFLHIYEPHVPYAPPEPYRSRFRMAYDGEIATADAIIGEFLEHLRSSGIYDRALIIFTSDHGEGLGDHGEEQHSILLYREALHVPLMVKLPHQQRAGESVDHTVGLIDIAPTVYEITGIRPQSKTSGLSLTASNGDSSLRTVYSETLYPLIHFGWSPLRSLVDGRYQYIESTDAELYDYRGDSGERSNVTAAQRRVAASMREKLASIPRGPIQVGEIDPEAAAKLSALGYIGGARPRTETGNLPDPARMIGTFEEIRRAFELSDGARPAEGIDALRRLLEANPAQFEVRVKLAEVLAREGRNEEAAGQYAEAIKRSSIFPADVAIASGTLLLRMGRVAEAEQHARSAMTDVPARAHELLARSAMARKNFVDARTEAKAAYEARPSASALVFLAEVQEKSGAMTEALSTLEEAEALGARQGSTKTFRLNFVRGDALGRMERLSEAEQAYDREVRDFPSDVEAWAALALVKFLRGDRAGMMSTLEGMVKANPNRGAYLLAAKTLEALGESAAAREWRARGR